MYWRQNSIFTYIISSTLSYQKSAALYSSSTTNCFVRVNEILTGVVAYIHRYFLLLYFEPHLFFHTFVQETFLAKSSETTLLWLSCWFYMRSISISHPFPRRLTESLTDWLTHSLRLPSGRHVIRKHWASLYSPLVFWHSSFAFPFNPSPPFSHLLRILPQTRRPSSSPSTSC